MEYYTLSESKINELIAGLLFVEEQRHATLEIKQSTIGLTVSEAAEYERLTEGLPRLHRVAGIEEATKTSAEEGGSPPDLGATSSADPMQDELPIEQEQHND